MRAEPYGPEERGLEIGPEIGDGKVLVPPAVAAGSIIYVRTLLTHPMDTGLFRHPDGSPIPAYFVNDVAVFYGEERIAHFEWTSGVSRDPFVTFPLRATREATLRVVWRDTTGAVFEQSAPITFA